MPAKDMKKDIIWSHHDITVSIYVQKLTWNIRHLIYVNHAIVMLLDKRKIHCIWPTLYIS